ncbi:MAG: hypothetical protein A2831_02200 [Candidatus Yanofskybacteria bacterium RIFCSPHIGHO2_01_FULL_44_17]|uniref:Glycosyl transferase family 1 domain-containing protein n=1 Tax=Candidatus Yanofskybacteria bacterium RIFCSPHIGHO2_01_FULL_44_17 TaxID=1802668 RepID=A0A1F8ETC4_9BACT|nr:MAG: hypothetical protein A2831_02200 [Candidatus Yanofskybacteria bacterium RIFCSPHIGHO2_01_FULL_44_17]
MKILYLNITKGVPPRDAVYLDGFRKNGLEIQEYRDNSPGLKKFWNIYKYHRKHTDTHDILFVGYSAHILAPFLRLISRRPIIFNALGPLYDGKIIGRTQAAKFSLLALYCWLADFLAFNSASLSLIENQTLINYVSRKFLVNKKRLLLAWTGVNENDFFYDPSIQKLPQFTILFRGDLTKDSGVEYLIEAAKILANTDIKFRLLARGGLASKIESILKTFDSKNVEWIKERLDIADLRKKMQETHLSIGWLSGRLRAPTSIPHKTFESLALKLPFLHARLPAMLELLEENKTGFYCKSDDVQDLVDKILELKNNPELLNGVAENGYRLFDQKLRSKYLAKTVLDHLQHSHILKNVRML